MSTAEAAKTNNASARRFVGIMADGSAELPSRIEILRAGTWPEQSNKGEIIITESDLQQFKRNFDNGVGMAGGVGTGLPIDFSHDYTGKAAGWMKDLIVEGDILYADVEWSTAGTAALMGKEFKAFSPMFTPACLGDWHDPENWGNTARNVLEGGALTNIPFFKDLTPIMASTASNENDGEDKKNVIYVRASEVKELPMQLDEIRVKANADLSEDERAFLTTNKSQLTADELTKFGYEVAAPAPKVEAHTTPVSASAVKGTEGNVVLAASEVVAMREKAAQHDVLASRVEAMETQLQASKEKEVSDFVDTQMERGAIKADQKEVWVKNIMANAEMKAIMEALPGSAVVADKEIGSASKAAAITSALDEVKQKAAALVTADSSLSQTDAELRVMKDDKELAVRYYQELRN